MSARRAGGPLVVVGDALLDVDVSGTAGRLCPDEPAPVLDRLDERRRPGGAALTAWLAAGHDPGREVVLVTARADDADAELLEQMLAPRVGVFALPSTGATPVKTRVRAADRTLVRLDRGGEPGTLQVALSALRRLLADASAVLVSDYGRGVSAHSEVRTALAEAAWRAPLVWDPHPRGAPPVPDVTLATPNSAEVHAWLGQAPAGDLSGHLDAARLLRRQWDCRHLGMTLGGQGAALVPPRGTPLLVPARRVEAGDTCGAGDAFAAAAAVALARGAGPAEAVEQAVAAAADFVAAGAASALVLDGATGGQGGADGSTGPLGAMPAQAAGSDEDEVLYLVERCRASGGRVVVAGGCFDLLHAGHVQYLEAARALGDCLVVAMNGDEGVRWLKGEGRPLVPEADRARLLRSLRCVDGVVVFDEPTPVDVLRRLRPHVFAKGGDYLGADLPEAAEMARLGGDVVALPALPGRSTTRLADRIAPASPQPPASSPTPTRKEPACSAL